MGFQRSFSDNVGAFSSGLGARKAKEVQTPENKCSDSLNLLVVTEMDGDFVFVSIDKAMDCLKPVKGKKRIPEPNFSQVPTGKGKEPGMYEAMVRAELSCVCLLDHQLAALLV